MTEQAFVYDGPNVLFVFTTRDGVTTARRWLNAYGLDKRYGFEDYAGAAPTPGTGAVYEVHQDYRGSVIGVLDPVSGSLVSEYTYDSFGRRTVLREGVAPGYGFTGQQVDAETGLGYFRMRYYDPGEGRFLSEDPLGFPDGVRNAYTYVANAPYQSVDPFGLSATGPYLVKAGDSPSNDIYAELIYGSVTKELFDMFGEVERFLADLGRSQGGRIDNGLSIVIGGNTGRGQFLPSRLIARCRVFDESERRDAQFGVRQHGGDEHNAVIAWRLNELRAQKGARMIKGAIIPSTLTVDRNQFNASNKTVSTCRPDLQYNYAAGVAHMNEEVIYSAVIYKTVAKGIVMEHADPNGGILLWKAFRGRK